MQVSLARSSKVSVAYGSGARPMADTTTTTSIPASRARWISVTASRRSLGSRNTVPPYFWTTSGIGYSQCGRMPLSRSAGSWAARSR